MESYAILIACIIFPLILGIVFRVAASHLFAALMAGELLGRYFGHDVDARLEASSRTIGNQELGEIALIFLPMILTAVFLRGSVTKGKILLHILPMLVSGVILAAFVLPIAPSTIQDSARSSVGGEIILDMNKYIIGGLIAFQLLGVWFLGYKEKTAHGKHH